MGAQHTKSTICSTVCRWTRSCGRGSARTPGRTSAVSSSNNSKNTDPWLLWTYVSVELCTQPPRPCPSSMPVGRRTFRQPPPCRSCGERLRTRPLRRSAAHVAAMSASVAVNAAMRSRGRHAALCRRPGF